MVGISAYFQKVKMSKWFETMEDRFQKELLVYFQHCKKYNVNALVAKQVSEHFGISIREARMHLKVAIGSGVIRKSGHGKYRLVEPDLA